MRPTVQSILLRALTSSIAALFVAPATAQVCTTQAFPTTLQPPGLQAEAMYGHSISLDGARAAVGASNYDTNEGYVYVHELLNGSWTEGTKLTGAGVTNGGLFGWSTALNGDWLFVGCPLYHSAVTVTGAVFVFQRKLVSGVYTWTFTQKLMSGDPTGYEFFGNSVASKGSIALVGASGHDYYETDEGCAYVFELNGTTWNLVKTLKEPTPSHKDQMGATLAYDGTTAVIGAPGHTSLSTIHMGRAFVFERSGSGGATWVKKAELDPAMDKVVDRRFGASVAVSSNRIVVGATGVMKGGESHVGAAYVYEKSGSPAKWNFSARLQPASGKSGETFGQTVAITLNQVLVAANERVCRFDFDYPIGWGETSQLVAPWSPSAGPDIVPLGPVVAASGVYVMVGRPEPKVSDPGRVFPFHACGGSWTSVGLGTKGIAGKPVLSGVGSLQDDLAFELRAKNGAPSAPATMFLHAGAASSVPAYGGTLYTVPSVASIPLMLSATGEMSLPAVLPAGLSQVTIILQLLITDSAATGGVALSNGLSMTTGI